MGFPALWILLLSFICDILGYDVNNMTEKIDLGNGMTIRGMVSPDYQEFVGVPFAKPPLGELRFANPEPTSWKGNLDAVTQPEACLQVNYLIPNAPIQGSEDCLYLNIYRPNIDYPVNKSLDVMVFIHGGGFFAGSIDPAIFGPRFIMEEELVILVMMQYRLSVLGFLSTGDKESPGNFGFKDQALALQWIKTNIDKFGGNSDSITIFGQSAGATSVHMHMMSPLSSGLFHKAIIMSGSAIGPYNYPTTDPLALARRQAKAVKIENVEQLDTRELVEKLRQVPAEDLVNTVKGLKIFSDDPLTLYRTVVEPKDLPGAFITDTPWNLLKKGQFAKIPVLTGVVDVEGAVRGAAIISNPAVLKELNSRLDELLPKILEITIEGPALEKFLLKLKGRYLKGRNEINESNKYTFINMYTERSFYYPMYKALANMTLAPTYLYKFSYRGQYSYSALYSGTAENFGVVHCDDLIYLFESPALFPGLNDDDKITSEKIVHKFVSFATDPNNGDQGNPCLARDMKPMCNYEHYYKNRTSSLDVAMSHAFDESMVDLWDELNELS